MANVDLVLILKTKQLSLLPECTGPYKTHKNVPLYDMSSKNIFITGAAAGIGRETALAFARKGWFTGLFDVDLEGLDALRNEIEREIGRDSCCTHYIDVRDEEAVRNAITYFGTHTGGTMNVLFNNAGIIHAGALEDISLENHRRILDINIWGVLNCTVQALPLLKESTPATIVNMSSASALYGHPFLTTYAASKMAVRSMTEGFDLALKKHNIKVCDLMPIWVKTGLADDAAGEWSGLKPRDIQITPESVAQQVWRAAHGSRLHWLMGRETKVYNLLTKLLPTRITRMTADFIINE